MNAALAESVYAYGWRRVNPAPRLCRITRGLKPAPMRFRGINQFVRVRFLDTGDEAEVLRSAIRNVTHTEAARTP